MNKNFVLYLFYCIFLNYCNSQSLNITDISEANSYIVYPDSSNSQTCSFNFKFFIQTVNIINYSGSSFSFLLSKSFVLDTSSFITKDGHAYASFNGLNLPLGNDSLILTSTYENSDGIKIQQNYSISYKCELIEFNSLGYKVLLTNNFKKSKSGMNGIIQFTGLKNKLKSLSSSGGIFNVKPTFPNSFSFSDYQFQNLTKENIISLLFNNGNNITVKFPSSFSSYYNVDESNSKVVIYPSESTNIIEYGYDNSPLYSVTINKTSVDYEPYIQVNNGFSNYSQITPIYQNDKTVTYLGQLINSAPSKLSIYSEFNNSLIKIYETPILNITKFSKEPFVPNPFIVTYFNSDGIFLLNSSMFTITTSNQFNFLTTTYSFGLFTKDFQWPFGFGSGNNFNYNVSASFLRYKALISSPKVFTVDKTNLININSNIIAPTVNAPILLKFEWVHLFSGNYLLKFRVKDNGYEAFVGIGDVNTIALRYESMIDSESIGDEIVFAAVIDTYRYPIDKFIVFDRLGQTETYSIGQYYSVNPLLKIDSFYENNNKNNNNNNNLLLINNITFFNNFIDIINKSVDNVVYFTYNGGRMDNDEKPIGFMLMDVVTLVKNSKYHFNSSTLYFSTWNSTISMYQIKFKIPANTQPGHIPYRFFINSYSTPLDSEFLPSSAQLYVTLSNFDGYGPIFSNIEKVNSTNEFGWKFTIDDPINGFDYADIIVRGEMDSSTYKFHLTTQNLTRGDKFNGDYQINITLPSKCASQNYIITQVKLYDTQGIGCYFSVSESFVGGGVNNPFINYLLDSTINKLYKKCSGENDGIDSSPPILTLFTPQVAIPADGHMEVYFSFEATDYESGLKDLQYPMVYVEAIEFQIFECETIIKSKNITSATYQCYVYLPRGVLYTSEITFSVYGLINNGGCYGGYSSDSLRILFPYKFSMKAVSSGLAKRLDIYRVSQITTSGGELWIIGAGFFSSNLVVLIKYYGESTFTQTSIPTISYPNAMLINDVKPTDKPFIIKVQEAFFSNEFTVYPLVFDIRFVPPIPTELPTESPTPNPSSSSSSIDSSSSTPTSSPIPTNKPQTCLGEPLCGGSKQGYCSSSGCVCYPPWIGNDCNSQVIIIPQPSTNTSQPSTELPIIDNNNQTSNINLYTFDKWIYTPINNIKSQYFTSIQSGDTKSTNTLTTNITVTLEWFNQTTIIQFANNNITMNPSSIKYTIEITEYKFLNQLNSLQLVMSALFESSTSKDTCSLKVFGDTSDGDNSNFFKIQIDDHSLYGRFIKRAIIDSKVSSIENQLLDSKMNSIQTSSISQSFIGITIPNYKQSIIIDPDFSVLVDSKPVSNNDNNSICTSNKSKLTSSQLAGIIIGSVAFAAVVVVAASYFIIKKWKDDKFVKTFNRKLKKLS
ncbi:EGF-like domain-containing protein [Dictyostelium discoideum AX4]|uniref:EGF-like domain-containing protein n=1 Tax=Dictyostelium discoideum TaxID=44689 RepID=Q556L9_DICDI|nr:EGF-like domain-containing protein [Dictyostelium discoideum AX4]EAL70414.1 EGF-like domain-containing protein [Dictyostelium discoideum AX4]|eukprot:XP_644339.1 EGF-like domain-containing protein [Dictyostelium discoideum AX4]